MLMSANRAGLGAVSAAAAAAAAAAASNRIGDAIVPVCGRYRVGLFVLGNLSTRNLLGAEGSFADSDILDLGHDSAFFGPPAAQLHAKAG